jgi:hypothetical protein
VTFGKTPRFLHYVSAFNIKSTTWHKAVKKTVYESRILATGDVYSSTFPALRAAFAGVQLIIIDELSSNHPEQLLEINIKLKIACNEVQIARFGLPTLSLANPPSSAKNMGSGRAGVGANGAGEP